MPKPLEEGITKKFIPTVGKVGNRNIEEITNPRLSNDNVFNTIQPFNLRFHWNLILQHLIFQ